MLLSLFSANASAFEVSKVATVEGHNNVTVRACQERYLINLLILHQNQRLSSGLVSVLNEELLGYCPDQPCAIQE